MATQTVFKLTAAEQAEIMKPINGQGGLQSFGRQLQRQLNQQTGEISLTDSQIGRIVRHLTYGPGGFESRLRDAFARPIKAALK